jgi:hypothetical protein
MDQKVTENASRVYGPYPDIFGVSGPVNIAEKTVISFQSPVLLVSILCPAILIRLASGMGHRFGEYISYKSTLTTALLVT